MTEPVDQPALRDNLHPGADAGCAGAKPHQAKIAILKCFEDSADHLRLCGPSRSLTCGLFPARFGWKGPFCLHDCFAPDCFPIANLLLLSLARVLLTYRTAWGTPLNL